VLILGIVGSPRKGKNTDTLVERVLQGAASRGAEIEKIYLNDLSIRPCQACPRESQNQFCNLKDDMEIIYEKLERADGIVLGSPVYYETVTAQTKLMIDRCGCLADLKRSAFGRAIFHPRFEKIKKGVFIGVADMSSKFDPIRAVVRMFFKHVNITLVDEMLVNRTESRSVAGQPELLKKAFAIGSRLV
jgi:multimeric flavodoxin WrbA